MKMKMEKIFDYQVLRKGNHSNRHFKPEILVTCVRFSPTGK